MNEYLVCEQGTEYRILTDHKRLAQRSRGKNFLFASMLAEYYFWHTATRNTVGDQLKLRGEEESFLVYTKPDPMRLRLVDSLYFLPISAFFMWFPIDFFLTLQIGFLEGKTFAEAYVMYFMQAMEWARIEPSFVWAMSFWSAPSAFMCTLPSFFFYQIAKYKLSWIPSFILDQTLGRIMDAL